MDNVHRRSRSRNCELGEDVGCAWWKTGRILGSAFFTALNNGVVSAAISFLRTVVFQVLTVLILPEICGIDGVWIANVVSEVLACLVTLTFFVGMRKKYHYA